MRFLHSKIVIGGICIVVAAIFAFVMLPGMYKDKGETVMVLKLDHTVPAGTKITEDMLKEIEVGSFGLPKNAIKDKKKAVGKYARVEIVPEDILLESKISKFATDEKLDSIMNSDKKLVTVSLPSIAAGVGNNLQPGDIVSVLLYADNAVVVHEELKDLEVYSIENDNAQNLEDVSKEEDEREKIASTVTLIVTPLQAEKLVNAEYSGKLHMVFERRGSIEQ